ncbi:transient receptor potential cation channel subfamily A member 1a isoform X2 [Tachysurus fulvidraco]|uniref:transient receptor potential cation channel subfamily A member 1a isoform X2 n=1 Tax=Tachysurus fulvidraco TaxID=1234273 RepID=UPI001FEF8C9B|nr:transient receptor potential cation channel subfamily A member 1a isoform X2 [Tachysurus fulvidraco]
MDSSRTLLKFTHEYESLMEMDRNSGTSLNVFEFALKGDAPALEGDVSNLGMRDDGGASPLHYASSKGHIRVINLIVQIAGSQELDIVDDDGNTPLHWAVQQDQLGSCSLLLSLGANPNILNKAALSPLHLAVSLRHNHIVEQLLTHSETDVNLEGDLGNTPLILAASLDNHEALLMLQKNGARLCCQNKLGLFPIHAAAFAGAKRSMEIVLQKGEELGVPIERHINYVDKSISSPLHLAVRGGNLEVIKLCINHGAKIDQQQCDKSTALHLACTQGATEAVKVMLQAYKRVCDIINITDGALQSPLHKAAIFDHYELVEYLISQGADIDFIDCKGHSPLLLATNCGAWRSVTLLLSHGADLTVKDKAGCNFLHLAILQPRGLKNLPPEILQHESVRELLNDEDSEGCTPLHYACRLGIPDSVKNMLGLDVSLDQKSKQKKSALHFAAEYGRINTCHRLLETMTDTRLLNEGDEKGMTPLHLASRGGHVKVVELLLRKGALFHSDYKGWSCLHHAAAEGYTQTMDSLLISNIKLLDKTDADGNTALHLAARAGHVVAVRLLLNRGAQILLNRSDASFLHEAIHNGRKDVTIAVIDSGRCEEAISTFKLNSAKHCAVLDMIEFLPECFKHLLDTCIKESEEDVNSCSYYLEYNFQWLQQPIEYAVKMENSENEDEYKPLAALNAMVEFNRVDLLTHPVCKKYLEMKWSAYGIKAHLLNMIIYTLGVFPLTYLIVNLRPNMSVEKNVTTVNMVTKPLNQQCYFITTCMFLVLAMNLYAVGKEVVQMCQQRLKYLQDMSNVLDWAATICSLLFVTPLLLNVKKTWHWQAGALASLISWVNLLLYLQRFQRFGIYVVMFREICRTLLSIIVIFVYLILAFALAFYALMIKQKHFGRVFLSLMQTFAMMAGEINYQDNFLKPYIAQQLPFPILTYLIFAWFVLLVPILLMNLLIGLAVGDIAEVKNNACLKQIGMQIELHTNLEERLPHWFMKRVDQISVKDFPNKCYKGKRWFICGHEVNKVRARLCSSTRQSTQLERELMKQKHRLKDLTESMDKQHNLLKLIVQKMEINSEAEEHDGPRVVHDFTYKLSAKSKWGPLLRAVTAKRK